MNHPHDSSLKIGLGSAQFGLDYGINNQRGQIPEAEVYSILKLAQRNGINILDTASEYGESEAIIGHFLKKNRADFNIISKLPSDNLKTPEKLLNQSLKRLGLTSLYGYLVHNFKTFLEKPTIWDALIKLKRKGKVTKIGFSLYSPQELKHLFEQKITPDIIQVPFSILDRRFLPLFPKLKAKSIEIHTRSVFLQGLLFKHPNKLKGPFAKIKDKIILVRSLAHKIKAPLSAIYLNFAILNPHIDKVIIGMDSLKNLQENLTAAKHQSKVKRLYSQLKALEENDEKIILPFNWR